jgi:hypothetical protein
MARLSLIASGILLMAATPCFSQQNVTSTTPVPTKPTTSVPAAPTPQQNQTITTPTNVTTGAQPTNTSTGGQQGQRPSALSQLELTLLGNHSWFDPNKTLQFFQNDYQIINHSPNEICNVTLSAPLMNPESTSVESSYNVKISNSTQTRGIDILAPFGDTHSIPANGVMNIGVYGVSCVYVYVYVYIYFHSIQSSLPSLSPPLPTLSNTHIHTHTHTQYILMHPLSGAPGNTTAEENVSTGPVTIQSAQ